MSGRVFSVELNKWNMFQNPYTDSILWNISAMYRGSGSNAFAEIPSQSYQSETFQELL